MMKGLWNGIRAHRKVVIALAIVIVLALGLGLGLGLTLPIKSVEVEGEVTLLQGEAYTGGFNIKQTTRAGLIHREEVLPKMLSDLDTSSPGEKEAVVTYKGREVPVTVKVLGREDVTLRVREGTFPAEYEPNDPFPTSGVFDLYYNGELFRSAPVTRSSASAFTTRLSGDYDIYLSYNSWLSLPFSYTVKEIILSIEAIGFLGVEQGVALSKDTAIGGATFLVTYKDGTEKQLMIYDDDIIVGEGTLEERGGIYEDTITLYYQGFEIVCPVRAYPEGELFSVSTMTLRLDRRIYAVGESFDHSTAQLEITYKNFEGVSIRRVTTQMVPAITFDTVTNAYKITAEYMNEQATETVRVISPEDMIRVTDLRTSWHGNPNGAPTKGEDLDFEDATLIVEYGFGYREEEIPLTAEMVAGYDKETAGDQVLTITYEDCVEEIEMRIIDPESTEVTKILALQGWDDTPTLYDDDDIVIPPGASLSVEYGYGASVGDVPITRDMISGFTPKTLEPQTLIITCGDLFYTIYDYKIVGERKPIYLGVQTVIYATSLEEADYSTVACQIGYSLGDPEVYTLAELIEMGAELLIDEPDKPKETYDMRVRYSPLGLESGWVRLKVSTIFTTGIKVVFSEEAKTEYAVGEDLDLTGVSLYLVYSDDREEDISEYLYPAVITGFSTKEAGEFTATVFYLNQSYHTDFDYTVK